MHPPAVLAAIRKRHASAFPVLGLAALLGVAVIAALLFSDGNLAAGLSPLIVFGAAWALYKLPLRYAVYLVIYCGLTLNNPYEGYSHGLLDTPLTKVGGLLLANLNTITGVAALNFSGMDVLLAYLWFILIWRRTHGSTLDGPPVETARPMRVFALVSILVTLFLWGWGLLRGGDFSHSMWQIHKVVELPLFFFLCPSALRGRRDYAPLGTVIVLAGLDRAVMACYIRYFVPWPGPDAMPYATTHSDSMLFAAALAIVVAIFLETPDLK